VLKKDGKKEPFDIQKIKKGIMKACEKRVEMEKINEIVDEVEQRLRSFEENEIASKKIGEEIMKLLKKVDKVSYIRFASVYREFADVDEFKEEIDRLIKGGKK
jgi:transcriptional repressor NrdR